MPSKETIKLTIGTHRGQRVILIGFDYSGAIRAKVRELEGARWNSELKNWYIPEEQFDLHSFFDAFKGESFIDYSGFKPHSSLQKMKTDIPTLNYSYRRSAELPEGYLEKLEQKRYSSSTIRPYCAYFIEGIKNSLDDIFYDSP